MPRGLEIRPSFTEASLSLSLLLASSPRDISSQANLINRKVFASLLEVMMKKFFVRPLVVAALVFLASLPVLADTIRLKDGSVIRGQIVSFKNEQFTILVGTGARGRKSRITVYMEDVDSIEFDAAGNTSGPVEDNPGNTSQPSYQPPYQPPANTQPTNNQPSYQPPTNTQTNTPPTSSNPTFFQINVRVRADNSSNGWTNSGLVVRR